MTRLDALVHSGPGTAFATRESSHIPLSWTIRRADVFSCGRPAGRDERPRTDFVPGSLDRSIAVMPAAEAGNPLGIGDTVPLSRVPR